MKSLLSISILSIFLCFVGCQANEMDELPSTDAKKVELSAPELLSIKYESYPELNQTEVYDLIKLFRANGLTRNSMPELSAPTSYKIKNKYYIGKGNIDQVKSTTRNVTDVDEEIPVYEVVFSSSTNNKGLAIVSGDRRAPHILACIENCKDEDTKLSAAPEALLQWGEMYIRNEIKRFDDIKDSLYQSAVSKITDGLHITSNRVSYDEVADKLVVKASYSRSTGIKEVPENLRVLTAVYPMCPSTWNQWEPYNCQLPVGLCEKYFPGYYEESNYPTGSGVLSVAHLMACLEPSITAHRTIIDWGYLTENAEIKAPDYFNSGDPIQKRNMVGALFNEIYTKTKSHEIKNSNGVVTGTSCIIGDVESYLRSIFNCGKRTSWNINTVKNSLKAIRPVYVYGKPENKASDGVYPFILDGIKECYGRIDNVPYDINVNYLHANFGFGGGWQDGYYLMDIEKTTITFETTVPLIFRDNAMTIIPDIRKK